MPCLVIPLLTRLRLSHLDGIVAAHAIVRIHKPFAADSLSDQWVGFIR
ncbi:MAG: hypothetical protein WCH20_05995 [Nitrospira sp.]